MNSVKRLTEMERELHLAKYNGDEYRIKIFGMLYTKHSDKNTNGFEKAVVRFLELSGCQAERIKNKGTYIPGKTVGVGMYGIKQLKGKFIKGSGTNGTVDVQATLPLIVNGFPVGLSIKWDIKCKYTGDTPKPDQIKYLKEFNSKGGRGFFCKDFDEFVSQFMSVASEFTDSLHPDVKSFVKEWEVMNDNL